MGKKKEVSLSSSSSIPNKKRTISAVSMKPLRKKPVYHGQTDFCPIGYSKEQFDLYKQQYERIMDIPLEQLKQILQLNKQSINSNDKAEIIARCADGYALGSIQICPNCYGANPIYNKHKGIFQCAGYKQDDAFIPCKTQFQKTDLQRGKWNNNFEQREKRREIRMTERIKMEKRWNTVQKAKMAKLNQKILKDQSLKDIDHHQKSSSSSSLSLQLLTKNNQAQAVQEEDGQLKLQIKQENTMQNTNNE